jgi:predicted amino acid racemase
VFLEVLVRRNRLLVDAAIELHQRGEIPASSYVLDVDVVRENVRIFSAEASRLRLRTYPMTKQIGRNPAFLRVVAAQGMDAFVAVDMACARRVHASGYRIGNLGHLVQVPRAEAQAASAMNPEYWTVFSPEKAREASEAAQALDRSQALLARIFGDGDKFYTGHEGGFRAREIGYVADSIDQLANVRFAGITSFPALVYDEATKEVRPTPNLATLERAATDLSRLGRDKIEVNAPGTTSSEVLSVLASAGATQVEPGHGLTGTTPLHAVRDLPERPAVLYLSEVSHFHAGKAYCYGGGLYVDPVFSPYELRALVGKTSEEAVRDRLTVTLPPPIAIDYYGILDVPPGRTVESGDTVIFGFRIQAFVTRAFVVPISGISAGQPRVEGVYTSGGTVASWPG